MITTANRRLETVDEKGAAEILGIAAKTLQYWRWQKTGPAYVKVGRRVKYRVIDLEAFLDHKTVAPAVE